MIYEFFWMVDGNERNIYMRIDSCTLGAQEPEIIEKLMLKYIKHNSIDYNIEGFAKYLEKKGYHTKIIKAISDYALEFRGEEG